MSQAIDRQDAVIAMLRQPKHTGKQSGLVVRFPGEDYQRQAIAGTFGV